MDMHYESSRMGKIFFALCKSVDTPISLGAWLRFKHNQLALAEMELPVRDYLTASSFKFDYSVVSFLSKWKGLDTKIDLEAVALQKFTSSEVSCGEANVRIKRAREIGDQNPFFSSVIFTAKTKIASLLGPFDWSLLEKGYGWGPGATDDIRRRNAFVDEKLSKLPISCTNRALPIFRRVLSLDLHWSCVVLGVRLEDLGGPFSFLDDVVFRITEECIIDTVPKSAKTHRVIAKEPRANGFLQKGVGSFVRKRLKCVGVDLDDQGVNQRGASRAYADHLATLDLKAASDSMPIELVFELLPSDWASALDRLRSHKAKMPDGQTITLNKFSSMGNGFTFELESLIFWALASSVLSFISPGAEPSIYGDDIICPAESAGPLIDILAYVGFQVNKEKSFITGNFYESCGKHFFKQEDVTPCYQKEALDEEIELLRCGNRIVRLAYRLGDGDQLCKELFSAWSAAWRQGKFSRRFQIPFGIEGDDGWLLPADYFDARPQDANLGIRCQVVMPVPRRFPGREDALLAWSLRRGVKYGEPRRLAYLNPTDLSFEGFVDSSPDTTKTYSFSSGSRWVMPSGEFDISWR